MTQSQESMPQPQRQTNQEAYLRKYPIIWVAVIAFIVVAILLVLTLPGSTTPISPPMLYDNPELKAVQRYKEERPKVPEQTDYYANPELNAHLRFIESK